MRVKIKNNQGEEREVSKLFAEIINKARSRNIGGKEEIPIEEIENENSEDKR